MKTTAPATLPFSPRLALQRELARRCTTNAGYSLRAFARALGMSHAGLSLVLSGKRPLSRKAAVRIAPLLDLSTDERLAFVSHRGPVAAPLGPTAMGDDSHVLKFHQISHDT